MLSLILEHPLQNLVSIAQEMNEKTLYLFWALCTISAILLLWRLWVFTVLPALRPDEPKELPYWIPCKHAEITMALYCPDIESSLG